MAEQMVMSWMDLLREKRGALYSTVVVVDTNDNKRIQDFIRMRDSQVYTDGQSKASVPVKTYIYNPISGLVRREAGKETAVGAGNLMDNPIDSISRSLMNERNITVVIKNILKADNLPMLNLNDWATDDEIFSNGNTVVVFVPGKDIVDLRVLEKCILVTPPLSTSEERYAILDRLCKDLKITLPDSKATIEQMVMVSGGLDLNQSEAVFIETLQKFARTKTVNMGVVAKTKAEIITKSNLLKVLTNVNLGFESIGGYEPVKGYIIDNLIVPIKKPALAKELGVERPRGAILFGPGGTGKTVLSKAIAKELAYPFVVLQPEGFMSMYVGETERNLSRAIRVIEDMSPCIVFIDEIDRLGGRKQGGEMDGGTMQRAFSQFLEWLGDTNRQSIVIGATNMPYMDEAFRREGRFDVMIPMLSPDFKARYEILKVHLNVVRKVNHAITDEKLVQIATATDGWKGNMLEELVKRSTRNALLRDARKVVDEDIQFAFDDYIVNRNTLMASEQKYIDMAKDLCNSQKFLNTLLKTVEKDRSVAFKQVAL